MKSIKISLEQAQRVKDFVAITQECDFEILLKSACSRAASTSSMQSPSSASSASI